MFKLEDFESPDKIKALCENGVLCYVIHVDRAHRRPLYQTTIRPDTPEDREWLRVHMGAEQFLNDFFTKEG